ncbi:MAG: hypothetical protein ACK5KU_10865 [Beutenbergiaceae bacterium]
MKVINGASALRRVVYATAASALLIGSLAACSDSSSDTEGSGAQASEAAEGGGDAGGGDAGSGEDDMAAIEADLQAAQAAVAEALEKYSDAQQVTLTDAVDEPEMEYGMVSAPFAPSDAIESVDQVLITDGNYTITVLTASGNEYSIDQDGNIS